MEKKRKNGHEKGIPYHAYHSIINVVLIATGMVNEIRKQTLTEIRKHTQKYERSAKQYKHIR